MAGKKLGFTKEQLETGWIVPWMGNTYSGSSPTGLAAILDVAKPDDEILAVSYGSGAGSDAFHIIVQDLIEEKQPLAPTVRDYINRKRYVSYNCYIKWRRGIIGQPT